MSQITSLARPQRWDQPYDPEMTDETVGDLFERKELSKIDSHHFPSRTPLWGIIKNDTRVVQFNAGDIVVREGDYGSSAFLVLDGSLRVVLAPELPRNILGRQQSHKFNFYESIAQLWKNTKLPEVRNLGRYGSQGARRTDAKGRTRVFIQDIPAVLGKHRTASIEDGQIFGELAALGRTPRTATIFAETDAKLLEIRWQGLRELRNYDPGWRTQIDENYRSKALKAHLEDVDLFSGLSESAMAKITEATLFETYGSFDWSVSYKQLRESADRLTNEPMIAREGDYADGLLMVRAGFARVSQKLGNGDRTLTYLGAGDIFGLEEIYASWKDGDALPLQTSLRALGYVDVLRVPATVIEQYVFPSTKKPPKSLADLAIRPVEEDSLLEWAVETRYINGTQAMLIDLDKCVRCDDCIRACASTHGGNPRFIRHGRIFENWMVANACMHCTDPVCLIGCPTGAIGRSRTGGNVSINDDTCIGCGTCADSCPYDNIRLVEIRDQKGREVTDPATGRPIVKATKCDLCQDQLGGPACVRACPHGALERIDF